MRSLSLGFALALVVGAPAVAVAAPPTELVDYVTKKDESFSWKLAATNKSDAATVYEIDLVSQTWHDIKWDHKLQVFLPKGVKPQATVLLWNQGGTPNAISTLLGLQIAEKAKAPVAFLYGVPKQPLFGGKKEDALIAETFVRYLDSKDGTWPLLFPMVKSVVRGMDAVQQFAKKEWDFEVKSFVITGASKRGWTSWLTAATGDTRVKAIAPIVIDTLNMPVQMGNQLKAFGKPSEMIKDYTAANLIPIPDTPEAKKLWQMIDPWVYRDAITVPKLIINGANDPYWPLDALNTYWDDLKGDKWVLYVPNAGHDLREANEKGQKELLPTRTVNALAAFGRCMVHDKKMPATNWTYAEKDGMLTIRTDHRTGATKQRVWFTSADTRDFRKSVWKSEAESDAGIMPYGIDRPASGFKAGFAELDFEIDDLKFTLSSQIRITEAKKK